MTDIYVVIEPLFVIAAYALIYKLWRWVGTSRAFAAGLGAAVVVAAVS
jgi:hypothetical protein